jgi:hypothetical protein
MPHSSGNSLIRNVAGLTLTEALVAGFVSITFLLGLTNVTQMFIRSQNHSKEIGNYVGLKSQITNQLQNINSGMSCLQYFPASTTFFKFSNPANPSADTIMLDYLYPLDTASVYTDTTPISPSQIKISKDPYAPFVNGIRYQLSFTPTTYVCVPNLTTSFIPNVKPCSGTITLTMQRLKGQGTSQGSAARGQLGIEQVSQVVGSLNVYLAPGTNLALSCSGPRDWPGHVNYSSCYGAGTGGIFSKTPGPTQCLPGFAALGSCSYGKPQNPAYTACQGSPTPAGCSPMPPQYDPLATAIIYCNTGLATTDSQYGNNVTELGCCQLGYPGDVTDPGSPSPQWKSQCAPYSDANASSGYNDIVTGICLPPPTTIVGALNGCTASARVQCTPLKLLSIIPSTCHWVSLVNSPGVLANCGYGEVPIDYVGNSLKCCWSQPSPAWGS